MILFIVLTTRVFVDLHTRLARGWSVGDERSTSR